MRKISAILTFLCLLSVYTFAQVTPDVTSWIINTTGALGYGSIPSNVQQVQYSTNNVYVSCTSVPDYSIGPWPGNPNVPSNQGFVFKITRHPVQNTGTLIGTPLGHIGVWSNGVSIFNAKDAMSYSGMGIWNQNAVVVEGPSFDACLGHPAPNGEYHHHLNPTCLYDDYDSSAHSPIIGYAFDGFPIYGAYGFSNVDGSGGVRRIKSSFTMRTMTIRDSLPDGTALSAPQYGPAVSGTYPLGYYCEDFKYMAGSGDLDDHNGRFCVTPDYPSGIYAYFVTLDASHAPAYPYTLGLQYYGTVQAGNTGGPTSGHNAITETVTNFTGISEIREQVQFDVFPNPSSEYIHVLVRQRTQDNLKATLYDCLGRQIIRTGNIHPEVSETMDLRGLSTGIYFLRIEGNGISSQMKIAVEK